MAGFVAVTTQVATSVAESRAPEMEQPAPVTAKVGAMVPEPPDVEREMDVPTAPIRDELEIVSGCCALALIKVLMRANAAPGVPLEIA